MTYQDQENSPSNLKPVESHRSNFGLDSLGLCRLVPQLDSASKSLSPNLFFSAPIMMHCIDRWGRLINVNDCWVETMGYSPEEVIGHRSVEFLTEASRQYTVEVALPELFKTGMVRDVELEMVKKDGEVRNILVSAVTERDDDGQITHALAFITDITQRKKAEEAQRQSEENFRCLVDRAWDAVYLHDLHGNFVDVNQMACDCLGYTRDELMSRNVADIEPDFSTEKLQQKWQDGTYDTPQTSEGIYQRKDGSTFPVEIRFGTFNAQIEPIFLALARDISERKDLERRFLHSQKMEAVGRLAGGAAHDFNNVLTSILGFAHLAEQQAPESGVLTDYIHEIQYSAERAAGITDQLLAFSRRKVVESQVVDLNELVTDMSKMVQTLVGEDIEVAIESTGVEQLILGDRGQLEQVLMNLVVNARDAMPGGGILTIETGQTYLDQSYTWRHDDVSPGNYVTLTVGDNGTGMTEEVKSHVFEPFFTTKDESKGTGLGLATCYGIVKQSAGNIEIYSELGHGTAIKVYLPQASRDKPDAPVADSTPQSLPRGTETVLLVEDDLCVREMIAYWLQKQGYRILESGNGLEALSLSEQLQDEEIHLLLTDFVMPRMGGEVLSQQLSSLRPEMKVLFSSGYTGDSLISQGVFPPSTGFIQKPFTLESLAYKVREILDS
ncbi:MAG: PAS domain S-box protein [Dehalococcoidia bacterium]